MQMVHAFLNTVRISQTFAIWRWEFCRQVFKDRIRDSKISSEFSKSIGLTLRGIVEDPIPTFISCLK